MFWRKKNNAYIPVIEHNEIVTNRGVDYNIKSNNKEEKLNEDLIHNKNNSIETCK